ncbi:hypothetical protein BGZ99_004665 [Dissophora globulifera]|uniref:PIPK domain-containing protein n=1 Tax=Dissophora globulifera TaxID=979702 RepID=A0A9P6RH36_9FUNG|nr:hypothetical protein BGZ99_004665 [Dissophora globulifera]
MVTSKPLPPIPAPLVDKDKDKDKDKEKDRRAHHFPSIAHLKRRVDQLDPRAHTHTQTQTHTQTHTQTQQPPTPAPAQAQAQAQAQTSAPTPTPTPIQAATTATTAPPKAQPVDSFTSLLSSFLSSSGFTAATGSKQPSRTSTPNPSNVSAPGSIHAGTSTAPSLRETPSSTEVNIQQKQHQPAMVTLDQRSHQHLRAIVRQSIAGACLQPEILWQRLFMDTIQKLAANAADAWQQVDAAYEAALEAGNASSLNGTMISSAEKTKKNEVDNDVKSRPVFSYSIRISKHISSTQDCTFTAGRFDGESILLEEQTLAEQRKAPKEEQNRILLGGTISLSAGPEDLPKAEKILELLTFALCSLQLEAYLMRDHDVVRPESDAKYGKPPLPAQQNATNASKRASKGAMIFGWLSRGTLPAKYKRGTTQLSLDSDDGSDHGRHSIGDDFSMGEDLQSIHNYRFAKMIQQVEKAIISVSPDIVFPPPHLLLRLRDEEAAGPDAKRKSYTWEDVEFVAKKIGFGSRMSRTNTAGPGQSTRFGTTTSSVLTATNSSKASRLPIDSRAGLDHLMTNSNSLQGIFNHQSISFSYSYYWSATAAAPCNPPNLITVEYYRKEGLYEDMGLGEMIEYICKRANSNCLDRTCGHKRLEHISTYTHGEARINITVEQPRLDSVTDFESEEFTPFLSSQRTIAVWTRCKMCKARSKPRELSRASRLYSFGKYLELILYGVHFEPGPKPLCDHVVTKDAIARCFLYRGLAVSFEYESIDLFEMRISRLQVHEDYLPMPRFEPVAVDEDRHDYSATYSSTSTGAPSHDTAFSVSLNSDFLSEAEQMNMLNATRLEILHFYESCKKIIVAMEEHMGETKSISKHGNFNNSKLVKPSGATTAAMDPAKKAALDHLDQMGERWKAEEFDLYDQLKRVSIPRLNDLRNQFRDCIKGTVRLMESWQKEHHPDSSKNKGKETIEWVFPEYVNDNTLHTFPGSAVIVREDEPSSIIASTLSSTEYLRLVSSVCSYNSDSSETEDQPPEPPRKDFNLGGLSKPTRNPLKTSQSDGSVTLVARKNGSSGSESSTALTSTTDGAVDMDTDSTQVGGQGRFGDDDGEDADAEDSFLVVDGYQTSVKFLQVSKIDFTSIIPNGTISPRGTIGVHFKNRGGHGKNSTLSGGGAVTDKKDRTDPSEKRPFSMTSLPNSTPSVVLSPATSPSEKTLTDPFTITPQDSQSTTPTPGATSKNTFGYRSLTSGFGGTMKGLSLNSLSEKIGSGFTSYGVTAERELLKSDSTDRTVRETIGIEQEVDPRTKSPHIKSRFSHGKTSFSCIVYYAAEFDTLRRRCGIHQAYVPSLSRCTSWAANGGKSKSSFYKTKDDRFVIKQMVSSWNVAEKDALLKFAPKYFEYMENTHEAPTVLAKIFGFYTLKINNGETGQVLKIDVLVMEHLFYKQKITRTFDLKGIQDRHAGSKQPNTGNGGSMTLWDGDFIEGRFKALLLLHSHSKKIIRESLLNDTEFLASANIMDYSLLVGVDDERKELVVGIVDFIGAYTWYKRIESKGKTTLRGAKDNVTVLPPQQYKTRFREAMERYFLAVPDKWSKTVVEQEQEAKKEATNAAISTTVPESFSKDTTSTLLTPELERSLKNKTSGYLEKMSKAIMSSKSSDAVPTMTTLASAAAAASATTTTATLDTPTPTPTPKAATTTKTDYTNNNTYNRNNTTATKSTATTTQQVAEKVDADLRAQKLPRVFHPL